MSIFKTEKAGRYAIDLIDLFIIYQSFTYSYISSLGLYGRLLITTPKSEKKANRFTVDLINLFSLYQNFTYI